MKIITRSRSTWDGSKYVTVAEEAQEYDGAVAEAKGANVAATQLELQNKLQQQAFDLMKARQEQVNASVSKYLTGDVGFSPEQLSAMRSQLMNQISSNYNQGARNVMTSMLRRGSSTSDTLPGGDFARGVATLEGAAASDRASGLLNLDVTNAQTALTNRFNAASLINGQAAQMTYPISSFGSGASSALNSYIQAANSGFGSAFMQNFGGTLGKALGGGMAAGFGNALGSIPGAGKFI